MAYTTMERKDSLDLASKPGSLVEKHHSNFDSSDDDDDENRPPLPTRPAPTVDRGSYHSQHHHHHQEAQHAPSPLRYDRNKEAVMAYMIPLPRPLRDGAPAPQDQVPQRYMLYMPPSADRLKVPKDQGQKERKRDKAVRLWQQEVKKAKTYNGSLVTFRGMESASIRGAVWALNFVKPSDVTFLSRIPRDSIRSLNLVHPGQEQQSPHHQQQQQQQQDHNPRYHQGGGSRQQDEDMYDGVKAELSQSKKRTRRDFFIGTALLPVTTAIDLVIPVFGGLSEVNIVWMVLNATGWVTANKITGRLVLADSTNRQQQPQQQHQPQYDEDDIYSAGDNFHVDAGNNENKTSAPTPKEEQDAAARGGHKSKPKGGKHKIEMAFSPCPALGAMAQYVQAACHKCNPAAFPPPAYSPSEMEVLNSIGWTPERRGREVMNEEEDVAVSPNPRAHSDPSICL